MIYLDANATTPLLPEVLEAMLPWLRDGFSNPSGAYAGAKRARKAIDHARGQVAEWIGAEPNEIVFTGGGTESVNTALHSLDVLTGQGSAVVSTIEHSAVLRYAESLTRGTVKIPVTSGGRIDMDAFAGSLDGAAFVSIMAANNETGVIQPLREAAALAREYGLPVHTDAIQAAGKIPIDVRELGVDLLSLSAHKFHGPKGVGALFVREGLRFTPFFQGGGQESGRRSGTENTAGIVGMGAAAEWMMRNSSHSMDAMRDAFESAVLTGVSGVTVNGDTANRLPNTSHLSFDRCDAAGLLILLDEAGIACSAGSACMTGKQRPSHVQLAMGIPEERAKSSLRISFSRLNTPDEATAAAAAVIKAVEKLRRVQGAGVGPVVVYSP
ncbi:MAG: cysteine desulfurase family protein [Luteolibacter sp.]|uniref:cysteine desulfurase family protein n=1 Tax=Luteolibacter sp. TaxID=1962973 RepID=UPI003264FB90